MGYKVGDSGVRCEQGGEGENGNSGGVCMGFTDSGEGMWKTLWITHGLGGFPWVFEMWKSVWRAGEGCVGRIFGVGMVIFKSVWKNTTLW